MLTSRLWLRRAAVQRRLAAALTLVVVLLWQFVASAAPAYAHANLVRSEPPANSVLPDTPPAVQLWFSEEPEPRFSEIAVYTTSRQRVQTSALSVAPEDRRSLVLTLPALQPGTYTIAWKTLSAVDGHTTAGAFAFAVGVGQTVGAPVIGAEAQAAQTSRATPLDSAIRWLNYLAMAGLLGALAFSPLVLEPALARLPDDTRARTPGDRPASARNGGGRRGGANGSGGAAGRAGRGDGSARTANGVAPRPGAGVLTAVAAPAPAAPAAVNPAGPWTDAVRLAVMRRTLGVVWIGFWLTVGMTLVAAVVQAARAAGVSVLAALNPVPGSPLFTLLTQTRYGQIWVGRLLLLALLGFALTGLRATRRRPSRNALTRWWIALGVAELIPLTTSLNSHAAATNAATVAGAPAVPVLADWIHLVSTGIWVGGLVPLLLAVPASAAAAGPQRRLGVLAALVPSFSTVATVCVAALLLTGLYQSLLQVASWGALFGTFYGRALLVKLALITPLLLLGAYNLLVARPRLAREARTSGESTRLADLLRAAVSAEFVLACGALLAAGVMTASQPAKDAWAEATRGITVERTVEDLRLRLRVTPGEPGVNTYLLLVRDQRGAPIPNAEKVALIFTMVEHDMGQNELVLDPQGDGWYTAQTGLAAMAGTWNAEALVRRQGHDDVRSTFELRLTDVATSSAAQGQPIPAGTPVAPADARFLKNPVAVTPDSLAKGQEVYTQNCLLCHGVQGRGDGPAARALRPPPANLTQHVTQHTEGELWWWVTNGVQGTQMPAWKNTLSDVERWEVVNYIVNAFSPATR